MMVSLDNLKNHFTNCTDTASTKNKRKKKPNAET